jgi:hypothetical protein
MAIARRRLVAALAALVMCGAPALAQPSALPVAQLGESIVTIEGDGNVDFLHVLGAWRLGDGRIAVMSRVANVIFVFDPRGALLAKLGASGRGPGEFQAPVWASARGDTLFVYDWALRRATTLVLDASPRVLGTTVFSVRSDRDYQVAGRLSDGQWIVSGHESPGWNDRPGVHETKTHIGIIAADGAGAVRWRGQSPSSVYLLYMPDSDNTQWSVGPVPFSPWFYSAQVGDRFIYGSSAAPSLTATTMRDARSRQIELPFETRPPTSAMIAAARAAEGAPSGRGRRFLDEKFSARVVPDSLPYFGGLLATAAGELWLHEYAATRRAPTRYLQLNTEFVPQGWLSVPEGVRILFADHELLIAVHRDEDDLESIRVYRRPRHER